MSLVKSVLPECKVEKEKVVGMRLVRNEEVVWKIKVICDKEIGKWPLREYTMI
jgi:hypothetical protein